jgi:hypothetical protein
VICEWHLQLALSDLWAVDADLARGLQMLLDFSMEEGVLSEVFGVTFTASANPLVDSHAAHATLENEDETDINNELAVDTDKMTLGEITFLQSCRWNTYKVRLIAGSPSFNSGGGKKRSRSPEENHYDRDNCDSVADATAMQQEHPTKSSPRSVQYIELKNDGASISVDRGNRQEFVQLFVRHALYYSKKREADSFIAGLREFLRGPVVQMCTHSEVISFVFCLILDCCFQGVLYLPDRRNAVGISKG